MTLHRPTWPAVRLAVFAVYSLLIMAGLARHGMWFDEIQAWLIARDSPTLPRLFGHLGFEGHPALWYILLFPLAHASPNPALMQALQGVIAITVVAIVLWRAPFTRLEKTLFPFGYFTLFEYGVKSRSYALGFLLVTLVCLAWPTRRSHPLRLALLLATLANVHALSMLVSAAFLAAAMIDRLYHRPARLTLRDAAAVAIVLAGWAAASATALPPAASGYAEAWYFRPSIERLSLVLYLHRDITSVITTITFIAAALTLCRVLRDPVAGGFLSVAVGAILAFFYVKYAGGIWHHGVFFIAIVAAAWLSRQAGTALLPRYLFPTLLTAQVALGLPAFWRDKDKPISAGRAVAQFLSANGWSNDTLIGTPDTTVATVLGYLQAPRAFYPYGNATCQCAAAGRWGSFVLFDHTRLAVPDDAAILAAARTLGPSVTLLLPPQRDPAQFQANGFTKVATFTQTAAGGEAYAVYRMIR